MAHHNYYASIGYPQLYNSDKLTLANSCKLIAGKRRNTRHIILGLGQYS